MLGDAPQQQRSRSRRIPDVDSKLLQTLHAAAAASGIPVLVGSGSQPLLERAEEQGDRIG